MAVTGTYVLLAVVAAVVLVVGGLIAGAWKRLLAEGEGSGH